MTATAEWCAVTDRILAQPVPVKVAGQLAAFDIDTLHDGEAGYQSGLFDPDVVSVERGCSVTPMTNTPEVS